MAAFAILEPVHDKALIETIVKRLEFGVPSSHRQISSNGARMNHTKIAKLVGHCAHDYA